MAVKTKNPKSTAQNRIENEAYFLKILNEHRIGPRLLHFDGKQLILEFVQGERIFDYFENHSKREILAVIRKIVCQLKKLDELQINKFELTRPYKDLLIRRGEPIFLDFERCKKTIRSKNLRQFRQFLCSKKVQELLLDKNCADDINLITF